MTSRNQGLSPNDKGRQRRESLGTRLVRAAHSREFVYVFFCFGSCKTSQNGNISQLLT